MTLKEDKDKLVAATIDLHSQLEAHLQGRCTFDVELDGLPVKVDLTDAIYFAIGVEMGVTIGQIQDVTERKQFIDMGKRSLDVLQRTLGAGISHMAGTKK